MSAVETLLGWTLMGKKPYEESRCSDTALAVTTMFAQEAEISDFWRLDIIGITDPAQSISEEAHQQEVCDYFRQTTIINDDGRYEERLPWKDNYPPLPTNKDSAFKRLLVTTKKLQNQNSFQEYDQVMEEWRKEEIVPDTELGKWGHYLSHRHVLKENSTTRLRPVFDASAKEKNSLSLKQCPEVGPNFIELIPTMLLRFREKKIGVISDIRKAFPQISIASMNRDALRFFWWNRNKPDTLAV
ncbi:uncharacterized protein [Chelonus insularis]|uniref:uncharacterized protein n=1 Tax=Chelonus insularis TaxID=460826 RepID=UPI00158AF3CB|nr:uncharacterized protein LOC118070348 [Chelonus insularis]